MSIFNNNKWKVFDSSKKYNKMSYAEKEQFFEHIIKYWNYENIVNTNHVFPSLLSHVGKDYTNIINIIIDNAILKWGYKWSEYINTSLLIKDFKTYVNSGNVNEYFKSDFTMFKDNFIQNNIKVPAVPAVPAAPAVPEVPTVPTVPAALNAMSGARALANFASIHGKDNIVPENNSLEYINNFKKVYKAKCTKCKEGGHHYWVCTKYPSNIIYQLNPTNNNIIKSYENMNDILKQHPTFGRTHIYKSLAGFQKNAYGFKWVFAK